VSEKELWEQFILTRKGNLASTAWQ